MKLYMALDRKTKSIPFKAFGSGAASVWTTANRGRGATKNRGGTTRWLILEIDTDQLAEVG